MFIFEYTDCERHLEGRGLYLSEGKQTDQDWKFENQRDGC